jgi:hypothetical protein
MQSPFPILVVNSLFLFFGLTCKCPKMTLMGIVITFLTRLGGMVEKWFLIFRDSARRKANWRGEKRRGKNARVKNYICTHTNTSEDTEKRN